MMKFNTMYADSAMCNAVDGHEVVAIDAGLWEYNWENDDAAT
jgi:hypothetical protein